VPPPFWVVSLVAPFATYVPIFPHSVPRRSANSPTPLYSPPSPHGPPWLSAPAEFRLKKKKPVACRGVPERLHAYSRNPFGPPPLSGRIPSPFSEACPGFLLCSLNLPTTFLYLLLKHRLTLLIFGCLRRAKIGFCPAAKQLFFSPLAPPSASAAKWRGSPRQAGARFRLAAKSIRGNATNPRVSANPTIVVPPDAAATHYGAGRKLSPFNLGQARHP